jgi:hypothetical protein
MNTARCLWSSLVRLSGHAALASDDGRRRQEHDGPRSRPLRLHRRAEFFDAGGIGNAPPMRRERGYARCPNRVSRAKRSWLTRSIALPADYDSWRSRAEPSSESDVSLIAGVMANLDRDAGSSIALVKSAFADVAPAVAEPRTPRSRSHSGRTSRRSIPPRSSGSPSSGAETIYEAGTEIGGVPT